MFCNIFYQLNHTIQNILWINNKTALQTSLYYEEREPYCCLNGTTDKKNFETRLRIIELENDTFKETSLINIDGQIKNNIEIKDQKLVVTTTNDKFLNVDLPTSIETEDGELSPMNSSSQYLFRYSEDHPIKILKKRKTVQYFNSIAS